MTKQLVENKAQILKLAKGENFWGKRLDSKRREVAISIREALKLDIHSSDLVDFLDDNKPVKKTQQKSHAQQASADIEPTFAGSLQGRDYENLDDGLYIITAAQNNTKPHPVLNTLLSMAKSLDAEFGIMPIKYTTTLQGLERKKPSFHADVKKHLLDNVDTWLGGEGNVLLANSAQILPTAKQPINAAEKLNTGESMTIVASPRRQTKTLPRQKNGAHRWVYTTSVCTLKHYTDSRAGAEAEAEHCFGGILIQVTNGMVNHRRLVADENGVIVDNGSVYFPDGTIKAYNDVFDNQPVIVLGDLHCEKMCDDSFQRATDWAFANNPRLIVVHDALDFMSRNHHNREDWTFLYQMQDRAVIEDLTDVINHLNALADIAPVFIVESNHDLALDSWLRDNKFDVRKDPKNARTYHALMLAYIEAMDNGTFDDLAKMDLAFAALADKLPELNPNIEFGKLDNQKLAYGYDISMHGHVGTGGARGSAVSFKKMRIKTITAHTHSPFEDNNNIVVGVTGSMEMGYNKGGTTWDRANAIVYPNSTCQLIPMYLIGEQQY
ncbi:DNA transfer protein [Vibrio phage Ceto]|uniref:A1 protein n=1 Tax=Vibrio phage Ceto TaxID=2570300 RepID=A0A2H5BGA5_9CAUD|nr:DNA transfer protein [Vibrio phage Ceto]YP_009621281.1 DNA transfer protein [Vibrio phage Ceto]AUG85022.1 A1 protein [Vibrio phage Ceto]AUG85200.1 A1 protein [Vibrio phage Ceto]